MSASSQIGQIDAMAYHTVMGERVDQMRTSARLAEVANGVTPYVSPSKPAGALTAKQEESNQDRLRVKEIVAQNGARAANEVLPPPPSVAEMVGLQSAGAQVADAIYTRHPVKTAPFGSQVAHAYKQAQTDQGLYVQQVKLSSVYS